MTQIISPGSPGILRINPEWSAGNREKLILLFRKSLGVRSTRTKRNMEARLLQNNIREVWMWDRFHIRAPAHQPLNSPCNHPPLLAVALTSRAQHPYTPSTIHPPHPQSLEDCKDSRERLSPTLFPPGQGWEPSEDHCVYYCVQPLLLETRSGPCR